MKHTMVEVFQTDVQHEIHARNLSAILHSEFEINKATFDLEDCDRVLRVEGEVIYKEEIIRVIASYGYRCRCMEY